MLKKLTAVDWIVALALGFFTGGIGFFGYLAFRIFMTRSGGGDSKTERERVSFQQQRFAGLLQQGHKSNVPQSNTIPRMAFIKVPQDYPFARIDQDLTGFGYARQQMGSEVAPGEPGSAVWGDGKHVLKYAFSGTGARQIDVIGPTPDYVINDLVNIAYMPTV